MVKGSTIYRCDQSVDPTVSEGWLMLSLHIQTCSGLDSKLQ